MSLLSSIQLGQNTLSAAQTGLQVVGQNIANANTPGYIREQVNYTPAAGQRIGGLVMGMGVDVAGITQQIDNFLEQRLRNANSDASSTSTESQTYQQLEGLMNELGSTNLSTSLGDFSSSVNEVLNQPDSVSTRNLAVLKGQSLAGDINQLAQQAVQLRQDVNTQVTNSASDINRLVDQIHKLNLQIATTGGGNASASAAVGLTDQRNQALTNLSNLINISVHNQPDGTVSVYVGGNYLVNEGELNHVAVVRSTDRGLTVSSLAIAGNNAPLDITSGSVAGLMTARDEVLGGFLDKLDNFAGTLAFEFNKVYASGQGLSGYQTVTSEHGVDDASQALDAAGLTFTPINGSFQVQVNNTKTGITQASNITVHLTGLDHDTSLADVAAQLNQVSGITASIGATGKLTITSTSSDQQIAFANDTSGFLAAIGINTFYTGTDALSLGVNQAVVNDPGKFAASQGGIGQDTNNAVALADFFNQPLASQNGNSILDMHNQLVEETTQGSAVAQSASTSASTFQASLESQSTALSGVSIDEETINMLTYQRVYQASAKFISTLNDLLNTLVNL